LNNISTSWRHKPWKPEMRGEGSSLDRADMHISLLGELVTWRDRQARAVRWLWSKGRRDENKTRTSIIAGKTKVYWKDLTDWRLMWAIIGLRQLTDCSRCLTKLFPLEDARCWYSQTVVSDWRGPSLWWRGRRSASLSSPLGWKHAEKCLWWRLKKKKGLFGEKLKAVILYKVWKFFWQ